MSDTFILEKVKKLRALSTSSNLNEASNASAAAERLIQEHRIVEAELLSEEAPVLEMIVDGGVRIISWRASLIMVLCRNHSCQTYQTYTNGQVSYGVAGLKSDIENVRYLFSWLSSEILRLSRHANLSGKREFNSWYLGAVSGISEAMNAVNRESRAVIANSDALVLLDARMEKAGSVLPGNLKTSKRVSSYSPSAFAAGNSAGKNIHQGAALGSGGSKLLGK